VIGLLQFLSFYWSRGYVLGLTIASIAILFAPGPLLYKFVGVAAGLIVTVAAAGFQYWRTRRSELHDE